MQIVRPAAQPQIGDRRLPALAVRDNVIELQLATLAAASGAVTRKRTAALITGVDFTCDCSRDMTTAFRALLLREF